MSIGEANAAARNAVYVRSMDSRGAVATDVSIAEVVGIDQDNVRLAGRRNEGSTGGQREEFSPVHQLLAYRSEPESHAAPNANRSAGREESGVANLKVAGYRGEGP